MKTLTLIFLMISALFSAELFSQIPGYLINLTNDQQADDKTYEFDLYITRTGLNTFEYANNSQFFISFNPSILNGGTLSFIIVSGTCELNAIQQVLQAKLSVDAANSRLRIAAHSPSGAGTGTIISNTGLGTRIGRFRITNTVTFRNVSPNLSWYNGPTGFYTKIFAYVSGVNTEITNSANHITALNNSSLPVSLTTFNYTITGREVILSWTTAWEHNNKGFDIERRTIEDGMDEWQKIAFAQGKGNTESGHEYKYTDTRLVTGKYKYRLKQIDFNGSVEYFALNEEVEITTPKKYTISQNYPNPSNPKSKIDFEIPLAGKVSVIVYDMLGREVAVLINEFKDAGFYTAEFNGSNLASGVYFYRINADEFTAVKKMLLVK